MRNRLISAVRAGWYAATEPTKLKILRALHDFEYDPDDLMYGGDYPLVSVYVPTFNRCELLVERSLKSICAQSYINLEIIVAAHGCTDKTHSEVRRIQNRDRRIKLLTIPRLQTYPPTPENHWFAGPVAAANVALSAAQGLWIARNDDDDIWTADHVRVLLATAQRCQAEFVSGAYRVVKDGVSSVIRDDGQFPPIGGTQTWLYRSYLKHFRYNPDCWRKSHDRVNDTDLAERFRKMGVRIAQTSAVVAEVLARPGETTVGLEAYRRDAARKAEHFTFR